MKRKKKRKKKKREIKGKGERRESGKKISPKKPK
jgi:hypothetical protein